jgi:hypothetical protein
VDYTKFAITITEEKNNKTRQKIVEIDSLLGVTRFMNSYKPTGGYVVVNWNIDEMRVLV